MAGRGAPESRGYRAESNALAHEAAEWAAGLALIEALMAADGKRE